MWYGKIIARAGCAVRCEHGKTEDATHEWHENVFDGNTTGWESYMETEKRNQCGQRVSQEWRGLLVSRGAAQLWVRLRIT